MGDDRYSGNRSQGDDYGRRDPQDYGRDYGSGRQGSYSSARDYRAAGYGDDDRQNYGSRDYGNDRYRQREEMNRGYQGGGFGRDRDDDRSGDRGDAGRNQYRGSYGSEGRRFENQGEDRWRSDDDRQQPQGGSRGYGRQPQGYQYEDRGFMARAGDEVRSWFGDEDAEQRREADARYDERQYADRDNDYHAWRRGQMDALDRDYHEYRQENRSKFANEFATWRTARQGQRDSLNQVKEHMDVVGSDDEHVGTVDKVRGDRILLTKNDADAGGRHHSIPSRWIDKVEDKVTLSKSAAEAKQAWRDEENNQAMFGDRGDGDNDRQNRDQRQGGLNRSFSGT